MQTPSAPHTSAQIPVIDLFAGPGGLGEGFSSVKTASGDRLFNIKLSIEKESSAHSTLELRSFFRQFPIGQAPDAYYQFVQGKISREVLFEKFPAQSAKAKDDSWHQELCAQTTHKVEERIRRSLGGAEDWVLIGGPPCQAYSIAGRSRNVGKENYDPEKDEKQTLYLEYLQVIANHWPAVFIMENVKGLLSATLKNQGIFERILEDLESPLEALAREGRRVTGKKRTHSYKLYSINKGQSNNLLGIPEAASFVVRAEEHGIPQARHRVIILGIREDIDKEPGCLAIVPEVDVGKTIEGLPRVRSGISRREDSYESWSSAIREAQVKRWLVKSARSIGGTELKDILIDAIDRLSCPRADRGGEFIACEPSIEHEKNWFIDPKLGGVCNHHTRTHMRTDLHRYLYAACFAKLKKTSPQLSDFPKDLHPRHKNVSKAIEEGGHFDDRFRVQRKDRTATTITSHIAKDGHYYIHYDPTQCRSLTVREAARIQTFPDNYFFCGNRTSQYGQVGNAVPPLLAREIAQIVAKLLK